MMRSLLIGQRSDLLAFRDREEEGLLADDVQARFQASLGDFVVREVRRGDGDDLDAVLALGLLGDQRLIVGIEAPFVDAELQSEVLAARRVDVEGAADQRIGGVVPKGAGPVLVADLARSPAADHAPTKGAVDQFFSVQHCLVLFLWLVVAPSRSAGRCPTRRRGAGRFTPSASPSTCRRSFESSRA